MKTRCTCETSNAYEHYGGRGIRVCEQWLASYEAFRDWALQSGYEPRLEIDRIDVNGNYEPANCRWATRTQQMTNTRKRKNATTSKYKGVSKHSINNSWIAQLHRSRKTFNLGSYRTQLAAALAYDKAAADAFGEFAHVNFPERIRFLRERTVSHFSASEK